jgi:hypothetical protein
MIGGMHGAEISTLIELELVALGDTEIIDFIRSFLILPTPLILGWDYGSPNEQFLGWSTLEDMTAGARIAFCEQGFGPACPWGLVSLHDTKPDMGQDSGWFTTFLDAFFESFSSTRLPIYHVVVSHADGTQTALTPEGGWSQAWEQVEELRAAYPTERYDVETLRYQRR